LAATSVRVSGVDPDSSEPGSDEKKPDQPDDKDEAIVGTISPPGGTGTGLLLSSLKGKKAGAANEPVKKRAITESGEKAGTDASVNTIFALRLGNVNRAEGLLSIFAGGEEDKGDDGAVQNWRKTEMADTATPLGWIDDQVSMQKVLIASLTLLLVSIVGRVTEFYLAI